MRSFNFCAGPAALPEAVLTKAAGEMLDWQGTGMSVMEMSHRSDLIVEMVSHAENRLRSLLNISDDYGVLFLQGGATSQFAAIPLNLLGDKTTVNYVNTGQWSKKAIKEAARFAKVNVVASSEDTNFSCVPDFESWNIDPEAAYFHYCDNETIGGVEYDFVPDVDMPLVADMSSNILSRTVDVSRFGLIYAGAQKNIGPAGLTVVIVRKDLLDQAAESTPTMLRYQDAVAASSMVNTPPTYSIYLAGLVFDWVYEQGGVSAMQQLAKQKSEKLYNAIDSNDFYSNPVAVANRSRMNVPFVLANSALDAVFLAEAEQADLNNLAGHRSVGGMRASIYNAVPEVAVDALVDFMHDFSKRHG